MGFAKDLARAGTFGLAGLALGGKKKKEPSLLNQPPVWRQSQSQPSTPSMIGGSKWGS